MAYGGLFQPICLADLSADQQQIYFDILGKLAIDEANKPILMAEIRANRTPDVEIFGDDADELDWYLGYLREHPGFSGMFHNFQHAFALIQAVNEDQVVPAANREVVLRGERGPEAPQPEGEPNPKRFKR